MNKLIALIVIALFVSFAPLCDRPDFSGPSNFNNRRVYGPGEYRNGMVTKTLGGGTYGALYELVGIPNHFTNVPDSFAQVSGGAHDMYALTIGGRIAAWGDNANGEHGTGNTTPHSTPVFVTTDSLGNTLPAMKKIMSGGTIGWNAFAVSVDGRLFGVGDLSFGMRGNNTYGGNTTKWVQIPMPSGVFVVDANCSSVGQVLDANGNVYTWGGEGVGGGYWTPYLLAQGTTTPNTRNPTKVTLPVGVTAVQIAGSTGIPNYIKGSNGRIYGWSYNVQYIGVRGSRDMSFVGFNPWDITDSLGFTAGSVDTLVCNNLVTGAIMTDSSLRGWGSNVCSTLGIGPGCDMNTYRQGGGTSGTLSPWAWDQQIGEFMVIKPVVMMPGKHNFTKIYGSTALNFFLQIVDVNDSSYVAGRNKGGVAGNLIGEVDQVQGDLGSTYPNSWDVTYWTYFDPFIRSTQVLTTAQYFLITTTATWQAQYPINTSGVAPTASAGSTQNISLTYTKLFGSWGVTAPASGLFERLWVCTSKPSGAPDPLMPLVANDTVPVSGLVNGTYTFSYTVRDNNFKKTTASVTVNVGSLPPPPPSQQYYYKQRGRRYNYIPTSAYIRGLKHSTNETIDHVSVASLRGDYRIRTTEETPTERRFDQGSEERHNNSPRSNDVLYSTEWGGVGRIAQLLNQPGLFYETRRRGILAKRPLAKNPGDLGAA